jgi:probable rRNA maturation factor
MTASQNNFSLNNLTKGKLPSLPFANYKEAVLGADYDLTLNFVNSTTIHKLNRDYRDHDKVTDILSFPLTPKTGEIFICLTYANKKAKSFNRSSVNYLSFLVIHGLVHLKGFDHGDIMETEEKKYRKKFDI